MITRLLILLLLWSSVSGAGAVTVYRKVMPDGSVKFSDTPIPGGEEIEVDPEPVDDVNREITTKQIRRLQQQQKIDQLREQAAKKKPAVAYQSIEITSPQVDQIIRSNGGVLPVAVTILPPLAEGDEVLFYVDGSVASRSSSATAQLTGIANGRHQVSAAVVSGGREVIRSQGVEFHLLRRAGGRSSSVNDDGSDDVASLSVVTDRGTVTIEKEDGGSKGEAGRDSTGDQAGGTGIEAGHRAFRPQKVESFRSAPVSVFRPEPVTRAK